MMSAKGIAPIIAVLLMATLSIVASSLYYVEISKVMMNPAPADISVNDMLLAKHYGYAYFSISMTSNVRENIDLNISVMGENGETAWVIDGVCLPALGSITINDSGHYGSHFFVAKSYVVKIEGDLSLAYTVECAGVQASTGKLFILAIDGLPADGEIDPIATANGLIDTAYELGCPVKIVTTIDEWESILQDPPQGAIVANPYGGVLPAPDWAMKDAASAEAYLKQLGAIVGANGWAWLHTGGYPFQTISNVSKSTIVGKDGISYFFNVTGVQIKGGGVSEIDADFLTNDDGVNLNYFFSVTDRDPLPSKLWFDYSVVIPSSELPATKFTFYASPSDTSQSGAISLYEGGGYYIHWGGPIKRSGDGQTYSEYDCASIGLMMALYTTMR